MAHGYEADRKYEIAIYQPQCSLSGKRCADPERHYGDRARETDDLAWFDGTEAELRETAAELAKGNQWARAASRAILDYLA